MFRPFIRCLPSRPYPRGRYYIRHFGLADKMIICLWSSNFYFLLLLLSRPSDQVSQTMEFIFIKKAHEFSIYLAYMGDYCNSKPTNTEIFIFEILVGTLMNFICEMQIPDTLDSKGHQTLHRNNNLMSIIIWVLIFFKKKKLQIDQKVECRAKYKIPNLKINSIRLCILPQRTKPRLIL